MSDTFIMQGIFRAIKRKVDTILGLYVTSGRSVFTTTDLEESLVIKAEFRSIQYEVIINVESKTFFSGKQLASALAAHDNAAISDVSGDVFTTCRKLGLATAPRVAPSTKG